MDVRRLVLFALIVLALAALGALAPLWLSPFLDFAGANNEVIGGVSGIVQLVLWASAFLLFLFGLLRSRTTTRPSGSQERNSSANINIANGDRSIVGEDMNGIFITGNENEVTNTRDDVNKSDERGRRSEQEQ